MYFYSSLHKYWREHIASINHKTTSSKEYFDWCPLSGISSLHENSLFSKIHEELKHTAHIFVFCTNSHITSVSLQQYLFQEGNSPSPLFYWIQAKVHLPFPHFSYVCLCVFLCDILYVFLCVCLNSCTNSSLWFICMHLYRLMNFQIEEVITKYGNK